MRARMTLVHLAVAVTLAVLASATLQAADAAPVGQVAEQARKACFEGRWLLVQNRLDESIEKLQWALDLWPGYSEAAELLAQARLKRAEAQKHYDRAAALAKEAKWEESLLETNAALQIFPAYTQAKTLIQETKRQAAGAHLASGTALAAAGNIPEAEAALRRALDYDDDLDGALKGLAKIDFARAEAAVSKGLWGRAFLWTDEATGYDRRSRLYGDAYAAARDHVLARIRFSLGPEPAGAEAPSAATAALRAATWKRLADKKPDFLAVQAGAGDVGRPMYVAAVEAGPIEVKAGPVRTEKRIHNYVGQKAEPNPEYQRLRDLLDVATASLGRVRVDVDRLCAVCRGAGFTVCMACSGTGTRGSAPCPACASSGRPGWNRCATCGGGGRWSHSSDWDMARQELEVSRLQARLAREPATVMRQYKGDWPYTIEYHEKTGTLEATVRVIDAGSGAVVYNDALRKHRRYEDKTIQNANPDLGLTADPLNLPADEAVRQGVIVEGADEAAARVLSAVTAARSAALQAESRRLLAAGKTDAGIEVGTDAAVIKAAADRAEAEKLMQSLRDRIRLEERAPGQPAANAQ